MHEKCKLSPEKPVARDENSLILATVKELRMDKETDRPLRARSVPIALNSLTELFLQGAFIKMVEGLPKGSTVVGALYDPVRKIIHVAFEHESFDIVEMSEPIPDHYLTVTVSTIKPKGTLELLKEGV